jgi:hypothetical protein
VQNLAAGGAQKFHRQLFGASSALLPRGEHVRC